MDLSPQITPLVNGVKAIIETCRRHKNTIPSASDYPTPRYREAGNYPSGTARAKVAIRFIIEMMEDAEIKPILAGKKTRSQFVLVASTDDPTGYLPARPALESFIIANAIPINEAKDILYALCREATKAYRDDATSSAVKDKCAELLNLATLALGNIKTAQGADQLN